MKAWFGPKFVGIGIGPRSWEGWVATALFALGVLGFARLNRLLHLGPWPMVIAGVAWIVLYAAVVGLTYRSDA